ncbi:MAG: segregation and condensation protein A [Oscillospiraceae bacterium]
MENPTFRLEGIVRAKDDMEDFEGPLTLILQLLAKNKIEIQDIQISQLLEQYMAYLDEMKAMDLEIASEFVAMASHLVYIKARMLLSAGEETTELEELMQSLEKLKNRDVYASVKETIPVIAEMYTRGAGTIVKPPEYMPVDKVYKYSHEKNDLLDAMIRVLSREDASATLKEPPVIPVPKRIVYSVTEKTSEIISRLKRIGGSSLSELFGSSGSRSELVATFIALLELCRSGSIMICGDGNDSSVTYVSNEQ